MSDLTILNVKDAFEKQPGIVDASDRTGKTLLHKAVHEEKTDVTVQKSVSKVHRHFYESKVNYTYVQNI